MPSTCLVLELGLMPYAQAWALQDDLAQRIAAGQHPPALLLLEHPHTFTFGRRGQARNLIWDAAELQRRGVSVHWVDRGGDVTYHGPGQLVGYPLVRLSTSGLQADGDRGRLPQADYVGYLRQLEQVLILALRDWGLQGQRVPGMTGVWVPVPDQNPDQDAPARVPGLAKLAAIGVKVDAHGVTRHGFALNVNPDMRYWQGIIACGLPHTAVTSLAQLLPAPPNLAQVIQSVVAAFGHVFACQMIYPSETKHTPPG